MRTLVATLCLCLISAVSHADAIYRWTGADGKTYFGDLPPRSAQNVTRMGGKNRAAERSTPPRSSQTSNNELAIREDNCARKREQVENYRNATRLVEKDSLGREREFSEEEQQLLIARTEAEIDVLCGGL